LDKGNIMPEWDATVILLKNLLWCSFDTIFGEEIFKESA
jgi:hypothetical protein